MPEPDYVAQLQEWYARERAAGRLLDLKLYLLLPGDPPCSEQELAKAVYLIVTEQVPTREMTDEELAAL